MQTNIVETYKTHDNGGRPFKVEITKDNIQIYKHYYGNHNDGNLKQDKLLLSYPNYKQVFVGESPRNEMTDFSGGYGPRFKGNSILIQNNNQCIFIGSCIYTFQPESEIVEFVSPVGNNDVPYPWCKDSNGNTYLMIERIIVRPTELNTFDNPYDYYYAAHLIIPNVFCIPPIQPLIKSFKNIDKYFAKYEGKDEEYTMTYRPRRKWEPGMYVVLKDGSKQILTRKLYMEWMEEFGELIGCKPFTINMLVKRRW